MNSKPNSSVEGAAVIVSGASSGIGAATALAFATAKANLVLVGRRQELLEQTAGKARASGSEVLVHAMDVTDQSAVGRCIAETVQRFGRLDVLALVAGVNFPRRSLREIAVDDWRRTIEVNLNGAFYFVQAALPVLRAQGRGSVVVMGSDAGFAASALAGAAYSASKFGLTGLVQSINAEERRFGVRACVIQGGEVDTPLLESRPQLPPEEKRALMLRPEDVAAAFVYVASQPPWVNVEQIIIRPTLDQDYPNARDIQDRWAGAT